MNQQNTPTIRALLIEPDHEQQCFKVTELHIPKDDDGDISLQSIYEALQCSMFERVVCAKDGAFAGHMVYLDEAGLFTPREGYLYCADVGPQPYAGRMLMLMDDMAGGSASATVELRVAIARLKNSYISPELARAVQMALESSYCQEFPDMIVAGCSDLFSSR